ncbi:chondroitin sulfate synthase 1 [Octopus bimaculoides]|uniref:Hexosyltransferase n=1 Tax=Octopus bimaculoides TaxID=37653 RepID=A0A0L8FHY7_OCTBM|nr:chondroitin sulfate synthase 1 [Octopus bimaculoides]|eukprot:XP_014789660.1 PREDICTED: chondroitin sulfate synthase 1-like [Octopus bimaculoides]
MHFVDSSLYREKKRSFVPPLWSSENEAHKGEGGGSAKSTTTNDMEESEVVVAMDGLVRSSVNEGFEKVLRLLVANDSGIRMSEHGYIFVAGDVLLDETTFYNLVNYVQIKSMSKTTARTVNTNEKNVKRQLLFNGGDGGTGGRAAFRSSMAMAQTWDDGKNCTHHRRHHESPRYRPGANVKHGNDCEFVEGIVVTPDKLDEFRRQRTAVNCGSSSDGQTRRCKTKQAEGRFADSDTGGATSSHFYLADASYVQCFFNSKVNGQRDIGHTCQWKESLGNRQMENLKLTDVISRQGPRPAFQELYLYFKQQHLRELMSRSAYLRSEVFATSKMVSFLTHGKSLRYDYQKQFDTWNRYWSRNQTAAVSESFLDDDTHWKYTNDRYIYTTYNIHKSPVQKLFFKGTLRLLEDSLNNLFHELNFMSPFLESVKFHHSYQHFSPLFGVWHFVNVIASSSNMTVSKNTTTNNNNNNNNNSSDRGRNIMAAVTDRKLANLMFLTAEKFRQLQVTEFSNWSDQTFFSSSSSYSSSLTSEHISIIVPVAGRDDAFNRFHAMLRPVLANDTNISFIFIIFIQAGNNDKITFINQLQLEYPHVSIRSVFRRTTFSRAEALQIGVSLVEHDDVILSFMDIDMVFTSSFLARVRQFTVRHQRAYFPIYFSQYASADKCDPRYPALCAPFRFRPDDGFWRFYGYGMASIYKSDFLSVGGYDLKIKGWGLEDLKLYETCINKNMEVFRAPDPGLVHIYHSKSCSPSLAANQYSMCQETKFSIYLHEHTSAELVYGEQELIDRTPPWK